MSTRAQWMLVTFAVLGVLAVLARTNRGSVVVASVTDAVAGVARGLRNNNPGNVRLTSPATQWVGWVGADRQTDRSFAQFTDPRGGIRAALVVFRNYQSRYGLKNVRELISRWAPPIENDTESYVASVAARVGIAPGFAIDLRNRDTAFDFLRAVFRHENGVAAELIPASTIYEGIEAAA